MDQNLKFEIIPIRKERYNIIYVSYRKQRNESSKIWIFEIRILLNSVFKDLLYEIINSYFKFDVIPI